MAIYTLPDLPYDYAALAPHLDYAVLMAYDYHYVGGTKPGPIAPIGWVRQVARFAATSFGKEKTILGVPFYGFDWREFRQEIPKSLYRTNLPGTIKLSRGASSRMIALGRINAPVDTS